MTTKIQSHEDKKKDQTFINLRIPSYILIAIDKIVSKRVGISRTGWILETLHERIQGLNHD